MQLHLRSPFVGFRAATTGWAATFKRQSAGAAELSFRHVRFDKRARYRVEHPLDMAIPCITGAVCVVHDHRPEGASIEAGDTDVCRHRSQMIWQALKPVSFRLERRA